MIAFDPFGLAPVYMDSDTAVDYESFRATYYYHTGRPYEYEQTECDWEVCTVSVEYDTGYISPSRPLSDYNLALSITSICLGKVSKRVDKAAYHICSAATYVITGVSLEQAILDDLDEIPESLNGYTKFTITRYYYSYQPIHTANGVVYGVAPTIKSEVYYLSEKTGDFFEGNYGLRIGYVP